MESVSKVMKNGSHLVLGAVTVCMIVITYARTCAWLYDRYTAPDSYYSHGFLIPLVSAFLIWKKRSLLASITFQPCLSGLWLVAGSLSVHLAALALDVFSASAFSLPFLLAGVSLFLFGKRFTTAIRFELTFLVFMLPLPLSVINSVGFPLKTAVTGIAVFIMNLFGIPVQHQGFELLFPSGRALTVENPCSGLRSLIVLLALGSVFAYTLKANLSRRLYLLALSAAMAVAANAVRVFTLSLAVYVYGSGAAQGIFHDVTGYAVFAASFVVLRSAWSRLK